MLTVSEIHYIQSSSDFLERSNEDVIAIPPKREKQSQWIAEFAPRLTRIPTPRNDNILIILMGRRNNGKE